jgi:hypothetical protein
MTERITTDRALQAWAEAGADRPITEVVRLARRDLRLFIQQAAEREARDAHELACTEALVSMRFGDGGE